MFTWFLPVDEVRQSIFEGNSCSIERETYYCYTCNVHMKQLLLPCFCPTSNMQMSLVLQSFTQIRRPVSEVLCIDAGMQQRSRPCSQSLRRAVFALEDMAYELLDPRWDERHRCLLWSSGDGDGPPCFVLRGPRENWPLDQRFIPLLRDTGLLPIARMLDLPHAFQYDAALLSALVDRWRPETHTFHFRWGEMTVTLQDVTMLTVLPVCGAAVVPPPKAADWKVRLGHRFGHPIPDNAAGVPHGWLHR